MSEKAFVDLLDDEMKELIENLPQVKQLKQELEGLKEDNKRLNELLASGTEVIDYWHDKYLEEQAKNADFQKEVERLTEERGKYQEKWQTAYMNELNLQKQVDELNSEKENLYFENQNLQSYINNHEAIWKRNSEQTIKELLKEIVAYSNKKVELVGDCDETEHIVFYTISDYKLNEILNKFQIGSIK